MKKNFFLVTLLFCMCSCSKESSTSDEFVPLDTIVCTRTVSFNNVTKAGVKQVDLALTAVYNVNDDVITSFSITSPESDFDEGELSELKVMVQERFVEENGFPMENSDLNQIMEAASSEVSSDNPTADCFNGCLQYKKGEGRGWCRAGCILDCAKRYLEVFFSFFKKEKE